MLRFKESRSPYYFFVRDQLPRLQQSGLPVACVADGIPHCTQEWKLLTQEERSTYEVMAQRWNKKKVLGNAKKEVPTYPVTACVTTEMHKMTSLLDASAILWMSDEAYTDYDPWKRAPEFKLRASDGVEYHKVWPTALFFCMLSRTTVVADVFYFLNIYSHGKLPSHCDQRFLPCEIGCVKYSLREGIMADFHHFIDSEAPPLGFRYHCQTASDVTHKIPISGFPLPRTPYLVVIRELLEFAQPSGGVWPRFYCKSDDRSRISWCLERMASIAGIESSLELVTVEDLVIKLYEKKYQKEPSRTWVSRELDTVLWDFSSNTRCKWHEENDILCCALASCKKIAYCISKSLAGVYGVSLTAAHLPPQDCDSSENTNLRMVILDVGRFQKMKAEGSGCDRHINSPRQVQELIPPSCDSPCDMKTYLCGINIPRGRGVTRLLKSTADVWKPSSN